MAVKRYNGSSWDTVAGLGAQGAAAQSSSITTWVKTATGGETSLTGSSDSSTTLAYTPGQEQFFINGVLQVRGSDYTATNGTSITGITALVAGDIATVTTVNAFSVAGAVPLSTVTANGDLIVGTSSGAVGRLGIGSTGNLLTVAGGVPTWAAAPASMTLLSTTTLSGVSTTISSINTGYTNLVVLVENAYAGGNIDLGLQLNGDTASDYAFSGITTANGLNARGNLNTTEFTFNDFAPSGNQTKNNSYAIFNLPRYSTTSGNQFMTVEYKARWASNYSGGTFTCVYEKAAAITSMTFKAGNSTWTAGSVLIYGVN